MLYHVKASHKQVGDGYVAGEAGQSGISHDARERLCFFFFTFFMFTLDLQGRQSTKSFQHTTEQVDGC